MKSCSEMYWLCVCRCDVFPCNVLSLAVIILRDCWSLCTRKWHFSLSNESIKSSFVFYLMESVLTLFIEDYLENKQEPWGQRTSEINSRDVNEWIHQTLTKMKEMRLQIFFVLRWHYQVALHHSPLFPPPHKNFNYFGPFTMLSN